CYKLKPKTARGLTLRHSAENHAFPADDSQENSVVMGRNAHIAKLKMKFIYNQSFVRLFGH
ncbi:hypothetical protein JV210_07920, partial [Plesiomonas shigelloides]|uniref:hypothetical protein n=1 Tax=Plesiomonas shigelloides TaxID=703 RepID=UPI001C048980